jgi:hypothetical protein
MATTTLTPRQAKLAERKAQEARRLAVCEAVIDEQIRFNKALHEGGKTAILPTAFGNYEVLSVNADWWYLCKPEGSNGGWLSERSFCGCNDGAWDSLMKQVGEPRNALFAK